MRRVLTFIAALFGWRNALWSMGMPALALLAFDALAGPQEPPASRTVTLITGDRVVVISGDVHSVSLQPREGRERISFISQYESVAGKPEQHLYIIPSDALSLIGAGRLDRHLFDITTLLESRYDDSNRGDLPLILTYESQSSLSAAAGTTLAGASITFRLPVVNGLAAKASKEDVGRLWDSLTGGQSAASAAQLNGSVKKIWLDRLLHPVLDRSVPQINAPIAWDMGYEGNGVRVAVIDTGVDTAHPDLVGKVVAERNFTPEPNRDIVGHGTHVASIIAGTGAASNRKYRGVAPGAQLISAKVCVYYGCQLSAIIEGVQWAVTEQGAKIVNLSLGGRDDPEIDPMEQAINQLTADYGALFVVAAGNSGPLPDSVNTPASADAALAVAAVNRANDVAGFSSRGPRVGDKAIKPEISAPGVGIVAARADGTELGEPAGEWYVALSGTSMATPHVAGAAALLSQRHPNWEPGRLKAALMNSSLFNQAASVFDQGAGRVDVGAAFTASAIAEPASLSLGTALWPHDDDPLITREVTYRNVGDSAITLALQVDGRGPDGNAAPAGMFEVNPATLTIPAGGGASATLIVNTRIDGAVGLLTGRLVASGDGKTISTLVAIEREVESYDVVLRHIDRSGVPASSYFTSLVRTDVYPSLLPFILSIPGDVTLRLPAGRYVVSTGILGSLDSLLVTPAHVLNAPHTFTLDAREAQPITLVPPTPTADRYWTEVGWNVKASWGTAATVFFAFSKSATPVATATLGQRHADLNSYLSAQWVDASAPRNPTTENAPIYLATWTERETLPTGPVKSVPKDKLAVVRTKFASAFPDVTEGVSYNGTSVKGMFTVFLIPSLIALPANRMEYYYSEGDSRWASFLALYAKDSVFFETSTERYLAGRRYSRQWNEPPFAPAFPDDGLAPSWAVRVGNRLVVTTPVHGDQGGHAGWIGLGAHLDLFLNGQKIGEGEGSFGAFDVPLEAGTYRLEATATQDVYGLSTRVGAVWTFDSKHVSNSQSVQLPLMSIRFAPRLSERGQALRGSHFILPLSVRQLGQRGAVSVSDLTVEVSFDDGSTWKAVPVSRVLPGWGWIAFLRHPKQGDYVSLRVTAQGSSSNRVVETLIRAYGLTDPPPR